MFQEFVNWYAAPWSRIGRSGFNIAWLVASLPSLLGMLFGVGEAAGGGLGPIMDMMGASQGFQTGDAAAMQSALANLQQHAETPAAAAAGIDWFWWLDSAAWVVMFPLVLMRLRDVGIKNGPRLWMWAGAFYAGTVLAWLQELLMFDMGMAAGVLLGVVGFGVMAWLCVAPTAARTAPHGVTPPPPSGRVGAYGNDGDFRR